MSFNIKMFDSKVNVVVVKSSGYDSIVPHSHEFIELVYIERGEAENKIGNERIPLKSGDIFVMADKEIQHSIHPKGDLRTLLLSILFFRMIFISLIGKCFPPSRYFPRKSYRTQSSF